MSQNRNLGARGDPDAWLVDLSDELADEYLVVANPVVQRVPLSGIIVSPKGLIVLHIRTWQGHIVTTPNGPWRQQTSNGLEGSYTNPAPALREAELALRSFLHDEFPKLRPMIIQLVVLVDPDADVVKRRPGASAQVVRRSELAREINVLVTSAGNQVLDQATCESVALALQDRQISRNKRATEPFIFRSGNLLGTNRHAWTVQQAFRYMDRYPKDGIYHMRNGTLKQWLTKQGALHMAKLVNEALSAGDKDPRIALEKMLAKSELVNPRGMVVHPRRINLGRVLSGADCGQMLSIRAEAKRGYLMCNLETTARWLRAEPKTVSGHSCLVAVRVDTSKLPIQNTPHEAQVVLTSQLLANTITVPVRVRVVGEPSHFNRYFVRPVLGVLFAAIIGALIGMAMGQWGVAPPIWLSRLVPNWSPHAIWGVVFGLFWAIWGLVRGLQQPMTQPIGPGLLRWLGGSLLWMLPMGLLALAATWALAQVYAFSGRVRPEVGTSIIIIAIALAIVPSVLDKGRRLPDDSVHSSDRLRSKRPLVVTAISICLALAIFAGVMYIPTAWRSSEIQDPMTSSQGWVRTQYEVIRAKINQWVQDYYMRQYDRRAPEQAAPLPTRTPVATKTP